MLTRNAHHRKHNPFRRPGWRFERVLELIGRMPVPGRCSRHDDRFIRTARNFVLRYQARDESKRQALFYENPGLFYAYEMYEQSADDPDLAFIVQARLLAGQTPEEIANTFDGLPEAVDWYEKLFYNVRDRLDQRDWITKQVLLPAVMNMAIQGKPQKGNDDDDSPFARYATAPVCKPYLDGSLKFFAYFGGPQVLDVMLNGFRPGNRLASYEGFSKWLDDHWAQSIRRRSAQAASLFEINKFNVMDLFAAQARIMELARISEIDGTNTTEFERGVQGMLDALPWTVGTRDADKVLESYDLEAAELRDDELMLTAAGEAPDTLPSLLKMSVPESTRRER